MTYGLVLTREARSRLNGLRRDDPRAARLVGEAVTALLAEGLRLGPPLVAPVGVALRAGEPREALDYWYRRQLALLMKIRRAVADVKASRRQLDRQIGELGRQARRLAELGARAAGSGREDLAEEAEERRTTVRQRQALLGESSAGVRERRPTSSGSAGGCRTRSTSSWPAGGAWRRSSTPGGPSRTSTTR